MWHTVVENPNNEGNDISNGFSHYGMSRQTGVLVLVQAELSARTQWLQDESSLKSNSYHGTVMQDKIYFCVALITYHNISSTVEMHHYTP
jgi:hypothetical protein